MMRGPLLRGLRDSLSIGIGYLPVAVSFGLAAVHAGFSPWLAVLTSIVVYAGAAQFTLVSLIAAGSQPWAVIGIVLIMNLRHIFYGPALMSRLSEDARRIHVSILAAGLTDEVFATSVGSLEQQPVHEREPWYVGLQLGAYLSWVGGTALGAFFAQRVTTSPVIAQTLGFVLPALFIALLLEVQHLVRARVLIASAAATMVCLVFVPAYAAMVAGMMAGILMALRR